MTKSYEGQMTAVRVGRLTGLVNEEQLRAVFHDFFIVLVYVGVGGYHATFNGEEGVRNAIFDYGHMYDMMMARPAHTGCPVKGFRRVCVCVCALPSRQLHR